MVSTLLKWLGALQVAHRRVLDAPPTQPTPVPPTVGGWVAVELVRAGECHFPRMLCQPPRPSHTSDVLMSRRFSFH